MSSLDMKVAEVFEPLLPPSRYKGAYGGRGSGKSHYFASMLVIEHLRRPGCRSVCVREVLKSLKQSAKLLIEDKIQAMDLGSQFVIHKDKVISPGNGVIVFEGMQDHNAESIKSFEGFDRCWVEEAQTLSARSLSLLRPTIRKEASEIWFSWNPRRKSDSVDEFLRQKKPDGSILVKSNWQDNPWFPDVLEKERQTDLQLYPERYSHIWDGEYAKAFEGAYFAHALALAKTQGRIARVAADPLLPLKLFFDLGGAGARADAMAIWVCQFVGREIRVLDYIEGIGQTLGYYVAELRKRDYQQALCVLPHDGINTNNITGKTYAEHLQDAGFETEMVPNQGSGAAALRIEAVRRIMPRCWFNAATTEAGRDALGYYHERKDPNRNIGMGPEHDWSSHAADAFGLMSVVYEEPAIKREAKHKPRITSAWAV